MTSAAEIGAFVSELPDEAEVIVVVSAGRLQHIFATSNVREERQKSDLMEAREWSWAHATYLGLREALHPDEAQDPDPEWPSGGC